MVSAEPKAKPAGYVFGRPTAYDPAYCDMVMEWGRQGKSKAWMAAEIGVSKQTVYDWEKAHPDFLEAITRAVTFSQQWWEDAGQTGMVSDKFNSAVWTKNMAARFRDEWTERQELTGAGGSAIEHRHDIAFVIVDPAKA
jgi:transposase